jgi:uncharacterized membrane protein YedE/YeeE
MIELIKEPWPWYVAGPIIAFVMFLLIFFGKNFGFSANLRTMCTIAGAGKVSDFFSFDWKSQRWNLVFVLGSVIGGFISAHYLMDGETMELSAATVASLQELGFENIGQQFLPAEIFGTDLLSSPKGLLILIGGGFLVGFGSRYAGGCTSGHAISGLSDLQIPSLIAVIGFFIGGLLMTHILIPMIF